MIPLYDDNPTRSVAYVTLGLIAINVLVFFYELSLSQDALRDFVHHYGVIPVRLTSETHPNAYPTLLTSMFLHGSLMHLLGNMLYLWIFGNNIEDACGRGRFLVFYLLTGLAAAAMQIFLHPHSDVPMIGASGAVSGVLGAYLVLHPHARVICLFVWGLVTTLNLPAMAVL
ncbi:MAG: rhomboid family intramembrane serine protease, partial [Verrucomicrobiae bacterium]|nr:rhomboid family intramembrane serine protease [Verrucomicrobiae bacterium]